MKILNKLLSFESNELLQFKYKYDNFLIWPLCRYLIFNETIKEIFSLEEAHAKLYFINLKEIPKYIIKTVYKNPFSIKKRNIPIFHITTTRANTIKIDKKYFNVLTDYWAKLYEKETIIIENSCRLSYRLPRYIDNVKYHDYIKIIARFRSIFSKLNKKDKKSINELLNYLDKKYPYKLSKLFYKKLEKYLKSKAKLLKYLHSEYKRLFIKYIPQIILLNCASYGSESYITKWAKEVGIHIAEYQHGILGIPYKYKSILRNNSEYSKYIPDTILTFGEYWNKKIKLNTKVIAIGNPHYENIRKKYKSEKKNEKLKKIILIVSSGVITKIFVSLTIELNKILEDNYIIYYKLHPGEIPFKERYKSLYGLKSVIIIKEGDIYDLIDKADYVVAVSSLVVFEALGFGKEILIFDNSISKLYIPFEVGLRFKTAEELQEIIKKTKENKKVIEEKYLWKNNAEDNFKKYIKKIIKK